MRVFAQHRDFSIVHEYLLLCHILYDRLHILCFPPSPLMSSLTVFRMRSSKISYPCSSTLRRRFFNADLRLTDYYAHLPNKVWLRPPYESDDCRFHKRLPFL